MANFFDQFDTPAPQPPRQNYFDQFDAPAATQAPMFDPLGNFVGFTEAQAPTPTMGYGEQMGNIGRLADDAVRLAANGATFNMADRVAGGMAALTGSAPSYDAGVRQERARTQELRDAAPIASTAAEAAGGLAGGTGLMRRGVTLAGRVGKSLPGRILGYGVEGAAYGAAHGAGSTYSDKASDYVDAAAQSAMTGAKIGVALPIAGAVGGGVVRNLPALTSSASPDLSRRSSAMLRTAARADADGLRGLHGDTAMLVDAGPAMRGLGQGAATGTGPGRSALVNTLAARDAATGERLARGVDDILGPAPIPSRVEAGLEASRRGLGPSYDAAANNARAADTTRLANALDAEFANVRGDAGKAVRSVRNMLDIPGAPGNLDPHPRALLATRNAIDGMMAKEIDPNVGRVLGNARRAVDDEAARAIPGLKPIDAQYQELSRQSEGLTRGAQVLDGGKTAIRPAELADDMRAGIQPQGEFVGPSAHTFRMQQGNRADIDRIIGTNVNDLVALNRTLGTPLDWNSQKVGLLHGDRKRQMLADLLMQESNQRQTFQDIARNSQTAQRTSAARGMEANDAVPLDTTLTGAGARFAQKLARALAGMSSESTKDQIGRELSKAGPDAIRLADALLKWDATRQRAGESAARLIGGPQWIGAAAPVAGQR